MEEDEAASILAWHARFFFLATRSLPGHLSHDVRDGVFHSSSRVLAVPRRFGDCLLVIEARELQCGYKQLPRDSSLIVELRWYQETAHRWQDSQAVRRSRSACWKEGSGLVLSVAARNESHRIIEPNRSGPEKRRGSRSLTTPFGDDPVHRGSSSCQYFPTCR